MVAADTGALKIEEAQRAFQARYKMLTGQTATWPMNASSQTPPDYPPDGFYAEDLENAATATALVKDLAGKIKDADFGHHFTTARDGDIEGLDAIPLIEPPIPYGNCGGPPQFDHTIPWPQDIGVTNYSTQFQKLVKVLCRAKHVVLDSSMGLDAVGVGGKGTLRQTKSGWSQDEYDQTVGTGCSVDNTGSLSHTFLQTSDAGHVHVYVEYSLYFQTPYADGWDWKIGGLSATKGNLCGQPNQIPIGSACPTVAVEGNTAKIDWELSQYCCDNGEGGCDLYDGCFTVRLGWSVDYTKNEHEQRASAMWDSNSWGENQDLFIGLWSSAGDDFAELYAVRGKIYASLTNYTGSARCYLRAEGDQDAQNPPVRLDQRWHFFESSQTGNEWLSSSLGD
jgi:hypothetical protein